MGPALAIAKKDIVQLLRDRVGFFFVFIFPIGFGILFGVIFAGGSDGPVDVPLAIVDLDASEPSTGLITLLEDDPRLAVTLLELEQDAATSVRKGDHAGALVIPDGFGDDLEAMFFGEGAELALTLDPGRALEGGMIQGSVSAAAYRTMFGAFQNNEALRRMIKRGREVLATTDMNFADRAILNTMLSSLERVVEMNEREAATSTAEAPAETNGDGDDGLAGFQPVTIVVNGEDEDVASPEDKRARPDNAFEITFAQAIAWGLMSCVLGFGLGVVNERTRGTLTRLRLAPIAPGQIIAGKAIACFITCLGVQSLILCIGALVFGVRPDSWALLLLGVVCASIAFVGLAMLLASFGKSETATEGLARAVLLVLALIGGAGVPLAIMPKWVQDAASISPFKWVIETLDGTIWRQSTLIELAAPLGVLVGIGVVGFTIGVVLFRRSEA